MYQALYRKYRPKTFDDVVGQEHITNTLKTQVQNERVSHAYIFTGTRGTGKTSCAKILARAANCTNPQNGNPCNQCQSCLSILNESSIDVNEIDAASHNKVDDIRELLEETRYTPASLKKRVYIIDEVHMLTTQAFNALLKTLEEPPEHVLFILATTEIHKVLPTILSRCQRFDFKRIGTKDVSTRLMHIAILENINLDLDASNLIAKSADGGMRDALSILDRCILDSETAVDTSAVCEKIGIIDFENIFQIANNILSNNIQNVLLSINDYHTDGKEVSSILEQLLNVFRDALLYKLTKNEEFTILYSGNLKDFFSLCDNATETVLTKCIDIISKAMPSIEKSQNKRIDVEMCIVKLCSKTAFFSEDIQSKVEILEDKIENFSFSMLQIKTPQKIVEKKDPNKEVKTKPKTINKDNIIEYGVEDSVMQKKLIDAIKPHVTKGFEHHIPDDIKIYFNNDEINIHVIETFLKDIFFTAEYVQKIKEIVSYEFDKSVNIIYNNKTGEVPKSELDLPLENARQFNIPINIVEE